VDLFFVSVLCREFGVIDDIDVHLDADFSNRASNTASGDPSMSVHRGPKKGHFRSPGLIVSASAPDEFRRC
jgi:hypothetical protein